MKKSDPVFWAAPTTPAGIETGPAPSVDEFKKVISQPNFVGSPSDMKAYSRANPIIFVVQGYEVLRLEAIKVGWVRALDANGKEVGFITVSGKLTTDRMFIVKDGGLVIATNGKDGSSVSVWDAGSIANYLDCGVRNVNFFRMTSFEPRYFDVIEPNHTEVFALPAAFDYC
jgi:hypothetical protein